MEIARISTIALISLLGAMSPGPDFAVVTKNCMLGTFRTGFFTALGVSTALLIHVAYCLFGIAILIQDSPKIYHILMCFGSAYLFYMGIKLLKEKKVANEPTLSKEETSVIKRPFLSGFLCNLLNPKATLFIFSLFTQFIDPNLSFYKKAIMGSTTAIIGLIWFTLLSYLITHRMLQKHISRFQLAITKTMGVVLCVLAVYVVLQ